MIHIAIGNEEPYALILVGHCYLRKSCNIAMDLMLKKSKIIEMHFPVGEEEWPSCGEKYEDCWSSLFQYRLACWPDCTHKTWIKT